MASRKSHGQSSMFDDGKPRFTVPTMEEVNAAAGTNGFTAVSTFSGCGGSSLGLKMAGYNVVWANEFIPEAAKTYRENAPQTLVSEKNIREVTKQTIVSDLEEANRSAEAWAIEDLDLFEGSPPCASFSLSGRREAHWGKEKTYSDTKERVDDLFDEYIRLVGELNPKVFLAENVTGMMKGAAKGYLNHVLRSLKDQGYRVQAKVLDAQWLGVPQRRQRIIFLGVREDLGILPGAGFPLPAPHRYTVEEAIGSLDAPVEPEADMTRYEVGKEWHNLRPGQQSERYFSLIRTHPHEPCPTITQTGGVTSAASVSHPHECRKFSVAEAKRLCGFPDDFKLTGTYRQQYERLGRAVPPLMYRAVGTVVRDNILRGNLGQATA